MNLESLPRLIIALLGFYVLLYAPGQMWWHGHTSVLPRVFARVALSAAWTSAVGIVLAAASVFSIPTLFLCNALAALFGYLLVGRRREEGTRSHVAMGMGPVVAVLALLVYWPPFQTHMAASDSSSYLAAGIRLARSGSLTTTDPLLSTLSPSERRALFPSTLGYHWKPPYSRVPGGMVLEALDSDVVVPSFFPLPSVWAAVFADLLGPRMAGGYAALFCALGLWACWIVMRTRAGPFACAAGILVLALNAACYWSARFALSEPLVWFFVWAGLAAHDAWEDEGLPADGFAMGVLLGATTLVRPEYGLFIVLAFALRPLAGPAVAVQPMHAAIIAGMIPMFAATIVEVTAISGAYLAPISDTVSGIGFRFRQALRSAPLLVATLALSITAVSAWVWRRRGLRGLITLAALGFIPAYMTVASHPHLLRSWSWLQAYFGALLPVAAAFGAWLLARERLMRGANALLGIFLVVHAVLVLYDPHVTPMMPWASRRFVPVIVPMLALLAAIVVSRVSDRSRLAGMGLAAALVFTSLAPASAVWGRAYYVRGLDQVAEIARNLPEDGIVVLDHSLTTQVIGVPLWLLFGRPSLTLDLSVLQQRWLLRSLAVRRPQTPIYVVFPVGPSGPANRAPYARMELIEEFSIQTRLPEQTLKQVPRVPESSTVFLRIERVHPVDPRPGP